MHWHMDPVGSYPSALMTIKFSSREGWGM